MNEYTLFGAFIFFSLSYLIEIFTHFKLCLATAIDNFKWVKITHIWYYSLLIYYYLLYWSLIYYIKYSYLWIG